MKVSLLSSFGTLGFRFGVYETSALFPVSTLVTALLNAMVALDLCTFTSRTDETDAVWTNGITYYDVTTPSAKVGKGLWGALRSVDNSRLIA